MNELFDKNWISAILLEILYKWFFSRVLKFANVHCRACFARIYFRGEIYSIIAQTKQHVQIKILIMRTSAGLIGNAVVNVFSFMHVVSV